MEVKPGLSVKKMSFRYGAHVVFEKCSFELNTGITWLRGPNGAGKTTLLKLLGGALVPQHGAIRMGPFYLDKHALAYRAQSFLCSGDIPQFEWLTVQELLDLYLCLYPDAKQEKLHAQLLAFGMLRTLSQAVSTLSLGQYKKMQLSLALALPVSLLLIDEPFNGLDAPAMQYLREQLGDSGRSTTQCIVLTSHVNPEVVVQHELDIEALLA